MKLEEKCNSLLLGAYECFELSLEVFLLCFLDSC